MKHAKPTNHIHWTKLLVTLAVCAVLVCGAVWGVTHFRSKTPPVDAPVNTTTTTTEAKQAVTKQSSATILATGDLLMHIPVVNAGRTEDGYNYDSIFSYIKDDVAAADFAVANLESTFAGTEDGREYTGYPRFNCPDSLATAAKAAGFDMLLTANNHCNDTGSLGITRTPEIVKSSGLLTLGTQNADEPKYTVQDINGIRIGMVCYTYGTINDTTGQKAVNGLSIKKDLTEHVNVFDYNKPDAFYGDMKQHIADMEQDGAEAVVLFIHWGNEYQTKHNNAQAQIAQAMCDLGVDVIVGGHPHVVQDVELLTSTTQPSHKTLCAYSLGNAVSNQRRTRMNLKTGHTEDGALFTFTFTKYTNGEVYLEESDIIPTWVYVRSGEKKSYDILPLHSTVDDWKTALDLGDSSLALAQESYERTAALVNEGLSAANTVLTEERTAREAVFANTFL